MCLLARQCVVCWKSHAPNVFMRGKTSLNDRLLWALSHPLQQFSSAANRSLLYMASSTGPTPRLVNRSFNAEAAAKTAMRRELMGADVEPMGPPDAPLCDDPLFRDAGFWECFRWYLGGDDTWACERASTYWLCRVNGWRINRGLPLASVHVVETHIDDLVQVHTVTQPVVFFYPGRQEHITHAMASIATDAVVPDAVVPSPLMIWHSGNRVTTSEMEMLGRWAAYHGFPVNTLFDANPIPAPSPPAATSSASLPGSLPTTLQPAVEPWIPAPPPAVEPWIPAPPQASTPPVAKFSALLPGPPPGLLQPDVMPWRPAPPPPKQRP